MTMLSLAAFAAGIGTLIHWFRPIYQPVGMIVPPVLCVIFISLLITLIARPQWVIGITRTALLVVWLALAAASWGYTLQAILVPGLELVRIFPPVSALLLAIMVMVMLFFPGRRAFPVALLGWAVIALPVLTYLFLHPHEMWTPRGEDLLMAYGPLTNMAIVLLPMQRGLTGKIKRLMSERGQMEDMVNRDPLTRIYNRRLAVQVLLDILAEQTQAGVIMFDMDRFKAINDTHGHPAGDRVLRMVAVRCKELLRQFEIISRWGGEEFLVVVPDVDASELQRVAERLQSAIVDLPVNPVDPVTASFGITLIREGDDLASLLQRVDQALYQAKQRGGNCVVRAPGMTDELPVSDTPNLTGGRIIEAD